LHSYFSITALEALRGMNSFYASFSMGCVPRRATRWSRRIDGEAAVPGFRQAFCQQLDKTQTTPVEANDCQVTAVGDGL